MNQHTEQKKYRGVTDLPIKNLNEDNLDVTNYIEGLVDFIRSCASPMTIALQGDWGTGKTSFMNLVRSQLDDKNQNKSELRTVNGMKNIQFDKVKTIFFNTWKYAQFNQEHNLSVSFLSFIVSELYGIPVNELLLEIEKNSSGNKSDNQVGKVLVQLLKAMVPMAVTTVTGLIPIVPNSEMSINTNEENTNLNQFQKMNYVDSALAIESLKNAFEDSIKKALNKYPGTNRIVIFIDDLDRLDPEVAVSLLEVIKIFLDVENCVFVLSVDYSVVMRGIKLKNKDLDDDKAHNFFDKMIQVPFRIPMEFYDFEEFLKNSLPKEIQFANLEKLIELSIGKNPRGVKRLLNSYYLIANIMFRGDKGEFDQRQHGQLIAILSMQLAHEPIYKYLCFSENICSLWEVENEEQFVQLLEEVNISFSQSNVKKHILFLFAIREYLFNKRKSDEIDWENGETIEILEIFTNTLKYANITSESVKEEIGVTEQIPLSQIMNYSSTEYGVVNIINNELDLRKKTINGLIFEVLKQVIEQNEIYKTKMKDYTLLPEMKLHGIEKRLILPYLQQLSEQREARLWIQNNIPDYLFDPDEYSNNLSKQEIEGLNYEIITNYPTLKAVQNLYKILNYLGDENVNKTKVVLKKR